MAKGKCSEFGLRHFHFYWPVILSEAKNLCSRKFDKQLPRLFAKFTLSELRRFFASLRMTAN